MNETRDLIIGIDFGEKYSQICYYDRKAEEARSLPVKVGVASLKLPTCLCSAKTQDDIAWVWKQNILQEKKAVFLLDDLYRISRSTERTGRVAGEKKEAWKLLAYFIRGDAEIPGNCGIIRNTTEPAIAMETLNEVQVENLQRACRVLGLHRNDVRCFWITKKVFIIM